MNTLMETEKLCVVCGEAKREMISITPLLYSKLTGLKNGIRVKVCKDDFILAIAGDPSSNSARTLFAAFAERLKAIYKASTEVIKGQSA